MKILNDSVVESLFSELNKQFTVLGSKNENINAKRSVFFQKRCSLLNDFVAIPENYCKFYWDGIACWNATAPFTSVKSQCVSWPMDTLPPSDAYVERRCLNGNWENISTRTLEMLYKDCKVLPSMIEENAHAFGDSLNLGTRYIALTGYCCSAVALLLAFIVFIVLNKLRCGRNWIHLNLFISFFLRFFFCALEFIHAFWREDPVKTCLPFNFFDETLGEKLFILAWNYNIITSYFWVFIEGFYLHNSIYFYVFHESKTLPYVIFGWVTPFLIITALGTSKALFDNTRYWLAHCDESISWIIKGPLVGISIAELIITINIIRQLYSKVQHDRYLNERERYRKFAKSFLTIMVSIGGTYFIFDIVLYCTSFFGSPDLELHIHRIYIIVNSIWGIVIAYIYCFNNADIRQEIRQKIRKIKQNLTNFGFDFKDFTDNSTKFFISLLTSDNQQQQQRNVKFAVVLCTFFSLTKNFLFCSAFIFSYVIAIFKFSIFRRTPQSDSQICTRHAKSPLLSLSNNGEVICPECAISKKLLELNHSYKSPQNTNCSNTVCSTVVSSGQNTLHKIPQRVYPRMTHLSFCREEAEIIDNDL